jgi:hypothetical protein
MSQETGKSHFDGLTSLVDEATLAATTKPSRKPPKEPASVTLSRLMKRARHDEDMKWVRRVGAVALAVVVLLGGAFGIMALIPRQIPNIAQDPMDDVMDYVLLTDDFNNLPIDERLALVKDLINRIKTMSGEDSAMLAMFAASIEREMRRQMEENIKRLAVDVMDKYAKDYEGVPPEDADKFLDDKIVEFTRMMEDISGETSRLPEDPDERLAALRKQAQRDQEFARENAPKQMNQERVGNLIGFLRKDAEQVAGPEQRGRVTRFMRDVTRHLRGQDVSTGKPLQNGPG